MSSVATGRNWNFQSIIGLLVLCCMLKYSNAGNAVSLNNDNVNTILTRNDVVFVNFYADWCRFSQILAPVFDEAARKISEEFSQPGKVMLAKVDCDREVAIASQYRISKYPTLKLFRNGQMVKKEYRGQRSADSLANFIRDELKDPVVEHSSLDELDELDSKKRHTIGYFESKDSDNYKTFARMASFLRDDCIFHAAFGAVSASERTGGDAVSFRPPNTHRQDMVFMGALNNFDQLFGWAYDKCVPLVREITFENAEELTEEGLPFLILFHAPDDTDIVEKYQTEVARQLLQEKSNVNFLVADGTKFTHPLHHLGKSVNDLPVLAIDSFRHMYVFPHDLKTHLEKQGLLKTFIDDLHSGKLHREFHHGPDPTVPAPRRTVIEISQNARDFIVHFPVVKAFQIQPRVPSRDLHGRPMIEIAQITRDFIANFPVIKSYPNPPRVPVPPKVPHRVETQNENQNENVDAGTAKHLPKDKEQPAVVEEQPKTQPPESTFKKLAPSRNRYTILRDEL